MGDEWFQHRGGQPGWASRRPLLRPELLPHRRWGPLRAPRRERVLQQADPEEHLAEEAEAGHRQKCESRPPPVLPAAAGPPTPRASRPLRVLPSPRRTAVLPGAALRPPRPGGNLLIGQASGASRGVTEPRQAAGRGGALAMLCVPSSVPRAAFAGVRCRCAGAREGRAVKMRLCLLALISS